MAGIRPSSKPRISADNPISDGDALFVTNEAGDKNIDFSTLQIALRDGTGLEGDQKDNLTFATKAQMAQALIPAEGKYKISEGQILLLNPDDGLWYALQPAKSGGKTLSWKSSEGDSLEALSVNSAGIIEYPQNFIAANKIVTATGGQLSPLKAGSGLIGQDYNGSSSKTWKLDESYIGSIFASLIFDKLKFSAPTGEIVEMSVKVSDGVPRATFKISQP